MSFSEEEIYQEHILDHYEDPYHRGQIENPTHHHEDDNPLCGDVVAIDLVIDADGAIRDARFDGDGCCISQAAASMLMENIDGKDIDYIKNIAATDMLELFGAKLTANRQKCCLLPWQVLQSAIYSSCDENMPAGGADGQSTNPSLLEDP